jgi:O-antigen/teichoic acid export membrane protein
MTPRSESVQRNVFYSVLDYVSQPAMMIVAAPFLLRTLGVQQYGTWMLVNSIAATVSGLGGGFGDGAIKYTSMYRGYGDRHGVVRSLLAILVVNSVLGLLSAAAMIILAPWLINHVFTVEPSLRAAGIASVRISALLLLLRFVESVFTSSVRGCERYRPVVVLSVITRSLVIFAAVALAWIGHGLVAILWMTLGIGIASLASQAWLAHTILQAAGIWRRVNITEGIRDVFSFSGFAWLKSTLGVLIGYGDRLLIGALLGTGPLAFYTLCNQITQPIHSLIASGFNFIFPNLSAHSASGRWSTTRSNYRAAVVTATLTVVAICGPMILGARLILRYWLGAAYATQYHALLVAMIAGNGLLAISVVPHYAALAFGRSRALMYVNLAAGVLSLSCGYLLIKRVGLLGGGLSRIVAGVVFLSVFQVVHSGFREAQSARGPEESSPIHGAGFDFAQ